MNIVLAHGILGFGRTPVGVESQYFHGVADHFRQQGHKVFVPTVEPLGSLQDRADQLAQELCSDECIGRRDLIVVAHSMGGLDIRRVVNKYEDIASRVHSIITIATPHLGSPVADAVLDSSHPLRPHIPQILIELLGRHAGAIEDLTVRKVPHDPDHRSIKYVEVGCVASAGSLASPIFELSRYIGKLGYGGNDGVVTIESAKYPGRNLAEIWQVDHGEAIGWPTGTFGLETFFSLINCRQQHLARYDALLKLAL